MTRPRDRFRLARYERPSTLPGLDGVPDGAGGPGGGHSDAAVQDAARDFGMKLFLASLTMLFGGTFVAYLAIWWKNRRSWESMLDGSELSTLAAATVLLVVADVLTSRARARRHERAKAWVLTRAAALVASVYLVVQTTSWVPLIAQSREPGPSGGSLRIEGVLFLMVTFAHAVHVLGGVLANFIVLYRARNGDGPTDGALRTLHQYWRFLTVMWVLVLAALFGLGRA